MRAIYRLSERVAGFDFFLWLVMQKGHGATEVVFDLKSPKTDKWPLDLVLKRIDSILVPGPALAGMRHSFGDRGDMNVPGSQRAVVDACKAGFQVPRLKSVLPPGKAKYTVTLRRTQRIPERNSAEDDWRAFADEIGATVIEDYEVKPIHLHERMALYAGAEMNFFVTNGPVILCFLSEYPAMGFDVQNSGLGKLGIKPGGQYPFLLPQHSQIYEAGKLPVIRRHFRDWLAAREAA